MRFIAICLSVLALLVSAILIAPEFNAYLRGQADALSFYTEPDSALATPPLSLEGQYTALLTCEAALQTRSRRFMPPERREIVASQCRNLAQTILSKAPSLSAGYLVQALALRELGDDAGVLHAVQRSEQTGGDLIWMAERRFDLTLPHWESLSQNLQVVFERDIARLAQSNLGRSILARQYDRSPELRPVLIATVETLPDTTQRQFLSAVRRASQ